MGVAGINGVNGGGEQELMGLMVLAGINWGEWGLLDIGYWVGLSELVDIKGESRNE